FARPIPPAPALSPPPPVPHEPRMQRLSDDCARLGCRPFHVPLGVMIDESNRRTSPCIRCSTCDGHPCLVNAKADAQVICVDPALECPNVTLVTDAYVSRLETSQSGREVKRVHVERNGEKETYSGEIVVASCGAINSAALFLQSASEQHPEGLANSSGMVGRNYMCHLNSMMLAISKCENSTVFQKTLGLNDFYFPSKDWEYPMGHISFVVKTDAKVLAAGGAALAAGFTLDLMARHSLDFWMTSEDLPDPNNRIILNRNGGITINYTPNNTEGHKRLQAKLRSLLKHINCTEHLLPM